MIAGRYFSDALRSAGSRTLVYCEGEEWSGRAIDGAVDALAAELQSSLGIKPSTTVGMWFWNSVDFLIVLLAIQRAGFCALPADASASPLEARRIFEAAKSELVLVDAGHDLPGTGVDRRYARADGAAAPQAFQPVELDDNAPTLMLPRYVDHGRLVAVTLTVGDLYRRLMFNAALHQGDFYGPLPAAVAPCYLTVQQMSHGTARIGTLPFLLLGLPQVVLERFDAGAVVEAILRHAVTTTFMVPGMVERLCLELKAAPRHLSLSRLLYGGAKMDNDTVHAIHETAGPCLIRLYGSIEAGWPVAALTQDEHVRLMEHAQLGTSCIGRAIPGIETRIGATPAEIQEASGELFIRSRQVASRYGDREGWYGTGDLVTLNRDGYLQLLGRTDRMINSGAYHIYPQEIEQAIRQAFDVASVTVYGEPDKQWGEAVVARITWGEGVQLPSPAEFRRVLSGQLARYKVPRRFYGV